MGNWGIVNTSGLWHVTGLDLAPAWNTARALGYTVRYMPRNARYLAAQFGKVPHVKRNVNGKRHVPPAVYSPGKKPHTVKRPENNTVTVNGESRGPDWGKGAAAQDFEAMRREYERIPKGRHTEYDLLGYLL